MDALAGATGVKVADAVGAIHLKQAVSCSNNQVADDSKGHANERAAIQHLRVLKDIGAIADRPAAIDNQAAKRGRVCNCAVGPHYQSVGSQLEFIDRNASVHDPLRS